MAGWQVQAKGRRARKHARERGVRWSTPGWSRARVPVPVAALAWVALWSCAAALVVVAPARGDWLLHHEPCGSAPSPPGFSLVYPTAGMPAVVAAGATLEARVSVPVPLTPPPGHQQPAALLPWSARLFTSLPAAFGADPSLVYPLPVVDVRPEDGRSLRYRLRLPVPAWAAPGVYSLRIGGPGGRASAVAVVVVTDAAEPLRATGLTPSSPNAPEDLVLRTFPPPADASPPEGVPATVAARHPRDLWVFASATEQQTQVQPCSAAQPCWWSGGDAACEDRHRAVLRGFGARPIPVPDPAPTEPAERAPAPPAVTIEADTVRVQPPSSGVTRLRLLLPAGARGYEVEGALAAAFHPAGEWFGRAPRRLVLALQLAPARPVTVRPVQPLGPAQAPPPTAEAPASIEVTAGHSRRLGFERRPDETLSVRLSATDTYMGRGVPTYTPCSIRPRLLTAVAIGAKGQVRPLQLRLRARPGGR